MVRINMNVRSASLLQRMDDIPASTSHLEDRHLFRGNCWHAVRVLGPVLITAWYRRRRTFHFEPGGVSSGSSTWRAAWKHPMFTDAAILLLVFAAGYGLRAWISARRRRAIRKARGP